MKILTTVLTIACMVAFNPLIGQNSSQQIIKKGFNAYEYQDKTYTKHQLDFIFKENPVLTDKYAEAMKTDKKAKVLRYGTLGLLGFGVGMIAIPNPNWNCDNCIPTLDVIGALAIVLVPVTGTIAMIKHLQYISRLNQAIDGFNNVQHDNYGRVIEEPNLELSSSGVGFKISF